MSNFLLGSSRCGLSLITGIINCISDVSITTNEPYGEFGLLSINPQSYNTRGIGWLDKLNKLRSPKNKYIWMIRNPMDSICSIMSSFDIPEEAALQFWFDINTVLWYFYTSLPSHQRFIIKYEDVLLSEKQIVRLFIFLNLTYNKQYKNYGDFDQPTLNCSIFNSGRIDIEQVSPHQKHGVLTEEKCNIYRNKPLLEFLNYEIFITE